MTGILVIGAGLIGFDFVRRAVEQFPDIQIFVLGRTVSARTHRILTNAGVRFVQSLNPSPNIALWDVIVDASNAKDHLATWGELDRVSKSMIDLTPSGLGIPSFPLIDRAVNLSAETALVSCGAQTAMPTLCTLAQLVPLEYVEVVTSGASAAAGRATRANLDEYVLSTQKAITERCFGGPTAKVMVNINPGRPEPPFRVTIYARAYEAWPRDLGYHLLPMAKGMVQISPGFCMNGVTVSGDIARIELQVEARARWLPLHFGSVEVINANAIEILGRILSSGASS